MSERILLIHPDPEQAERLERALDPASSAVVCVGDARSALELLARKPVDIVVCSAVIAGLDGFDLVPQLQRASQRAPVLLACNEEQPDRHQMATRLKAHALVSDPLEPQELSFALANVRRGSRLADERALLERDLDRAAAEKPIVAASEVMIDLLEAMERVAGFKTPVLLRGERGTHKESLARAIHAQSSRRDGPFVAVSTGGRTAEELEARLYGAIKRRKTMDGDAGEIHMADRGTLYISEIGALGEAAQQRLLHLLATEEIVHVDADKAKRIDVRVLVGTEIRIDGMTAALHVPELQERIEGIVLDVPPLRDRRGDIPLLVDHMLSRSVCDTGVRIEGVSDAALERLTQYAWPGNLRELENVLERAVLLATSDRITLQDLPAPVVAACSNDGSTDFSLRRARRAFEAEMIRRALQRTDGNRTNAAKLLEISHRALLYKIKEYGLRD